MKNTFISAVFVVALFSLVFWLFGCSAQQPGETTAEGHRRHLRNYRLDQQEMMHDIDYALHLDEPSKLTEKSIR